MAAPVKFVLIVTLFFSCVHCWIPKIINGRPKGGMLGAPKAPKNVHKTPEQWFEIQRLDHFDGSNKNVWSQRYFVNDSYYKPGGPIFLMIGGEGPANPIWMVTGAWIDMYAKVYGAICVMLEHRYYGASHPVKDLSVDNMKFLSSRQALADLAYFIDYFREKRKLSDNKLITFGGSYPGSLSAWFRSKYPYMVDGAVATSAPIFAKLDFLEYLEVVDASLDTYSQQCNKEISTATQTMYTWLQQSQTRSKLEKMFKLCDKLDPTNGLDMAGFFANTAGNFEGVVQYNKDNRAFERAVGTDITIDTLCGIMTDFTKGSMAIERYAMVNTLLLKTYSQDCLDFTYTKMIDDLKKTSWNSSAGEGGRQWMYQTCAEFGWFQTSNSANQPFSKPETFPYTYSTVQCKDIFGINASLIFNNVDDTNRYYGGRNLSVTKVVFPNGSIDPWHAMGVTKDLSQDATAIYINGTAHCANMYPSTSSDLPELTASRQKIGQLIGVWISS